ncbi:M48 family metalloprotease [Candidatus Nitronereus thalassa]|uniref:M48 family metalloprotease n=1 Tax=Candidatus Nitronereus thalassa TaxID=3020898 RepID=A0ABU3KC68_9BACT|nr:M48 family metalloprotease [Candidatus Nitronereus thalassa]MDT7043981.1 M48 family metalloprotease [Candidatus Nitronereus thalassa]
MRSIAIGIGLLIMAITVNFSYAFDFGEVLKKLDKKEDLSTILKKEKSPPSSQDQKAKNPPSLTDVAGLLKGTSVEEEIAIGQEIAGRLLGAAPLVPDESLQRYVNKVGMWVALQSGRNDLPWSFGVLESEDINAFAAPGGFIFLTKGLYRKLNNEAELAGVLGHEIGHVIKQHHLTVLKKSKALDLGSRLLSSKLGRVGNKTGDEAIQHLIGNGAEIMARGLDKDAEYEADRIGVVLATRAGYDSYGLPVVLQEIGHVSAKDSSVSLLFKTHPQPDARLSKLGDAMGSFDRFPDGKTLSTRFYVLSE